MNCPICKTEMKKVLTTPCFDCGQDVDEITGINKKNLPPHEWEQVTFALYEIFPGHKMVLCDFCDADFGSYSHEYWGLSTPRYLNIGDKQFIKNITNIKLEEDWYCNKCERRLAFLNILAKVRNENIN